MPSYSWFIGRKAERLAKRFLERQGYLIVERNVHLGQDEIDLVSVHQNVVVFVEVRFRAEGLEAAELSVRGAKSQRLRRAVAAYRSQENLWAVPCRIDVVAVARTDTTWRLSHIKDAYSCGS
ncbi:MAG: putative endonuclease [Planctomycetota bacterium]|jgi:putative endonuclease